MHDARELRCHIIGARDCTGLLMVASACPAWKTAMQPSPCDPVGLYSSTKLMKESLQAKYVMKFLAQFLPASSSDLSDVHHRKGLISAFHS